MPNLPGVSGRNTVKALENWALFSFVRKAAMSSCAAQTAVVWCQCIGR